MQISIVTHGNNNPNEPCRIIEVEVRTVAGSLIEDVVDLSGEVDPGFIRNLREIADELENNNKLLRGFNQTKNR